MLTPCLIIKCAPSLFIVEMPPSRGTTRAKEAKGMGKCRKGGFAFKEFRRTVLETSLPARSSNGGLLMLCSSWVLDDTLWASQALKIIEFFRGRRRGGDNLTSLSKCSRPFIQSVKSTLSYLKSCNPVGGTPSSTA